jgi:hypothetical protein
MAQVCYNFFIVYLYFNNSTVLIYILVYSVAKSDSGTESDADEETDDYHEDGDDEEEEEPFVDCDNKESIAADKSWENLDRISRLDEYKTNVIATRLQQGIFCLFTVY